MLEPIEWTPDGWFRARGGTLAKPLRKPRGGQGGPSGLALSDDFSQNALGVRWSFFNPGPDEAGRLRHEDRSLVMRGKGTSLADCSPLTCIVGDRDYEAQVELEISGQAHGGLSLFYDGRGFVGIGFSSTQMLTYQYSQEQTWMRQPFEGGRVHLKLANRANVVKFEYSGDGRTWVPHPWQMEVSGFHHNVFGGFLSLRLGLFSAGSGEVRARNFVYRGLPA